MRVAPSTIGRQASPAAAGLRLYIARSTPNSLRAEQNLAGLLDEFGDRAGLDLETIDVFTSPKRAIADGVIVTPTLIGLRGPGERLTMIGDLTDTAKLRLLLQTIQAAAKG